MRLYGTQCIEFSLSHKVFFVKYKGCKHIALRGFFFDFGHNLSNNPLQEALKNKSCDISPLAGIYFHYLVKMQKADTHKNESLESCYSIVRYMCAPKKIVADAM